MTSPNPMIHVRVPRDLIRRVDLIGAYMEKDRGRTVERLLEIALDCLEHHEGRQGGEEVPGLSALVALAASR